MFRNNVYTFKNLPVQQKQRQWTDCICTICSAIFALTLFILSFVMYHRQNFYQVNYPVDDTGKTCGYQRQDSQLIYFKNPNDLSKDKYCVKNCPKYNQPIQCDTDKKAQCIMMGGSQYSTQIVINRLGAFCMPQDQKTAQKMWNSPQFQTKNSLLHSFDVVLISLLIAFCIGVIYLIILMFCPKVINFLVFITSFILLLIAGIFVLAKPISLFNPNIWNILVGVFLIVLALIFLIYVGCYKKQLQLAAIFMHHANKFLMQTPIVFAYIPLFIILTFLLIVLIIWQYVAFGTQNKPTYNDGDLYKSSNLNLALQVLNIVQLIWGLQFLRDSFNFLISGNAVQWYFRKANNSSSTHCCHPFKRLMCKNWGSVAGGSFLNAFFNIPDLLSDCFKCDPRGFCGKCHSCYQNCCCCDYVFQLVRTDAYAYINLTGIPYCNAARQCQAMCQYSEHFRGSQSCIRLYRMASHTFLVTLIAIISYFILQGRASFINGYVIIAIIFGSYCIVTYFIDIHADGAQGLMVCYLAEQNCEGEDMDICPLGLRNDVYNFAHPEYHN